MKKDCIIYKTSTDDKDAKMEDKNDIAKLRTDLFTAQQASKYTQQCYNKMKIMLTERNAAFASLEVLFDKEIQAQNKNKEDARIEIASLRNSLQTLSKYGGNATFAWTYLTNGKMSKEMIEFDLSEASPARNSKYSYGTGKFS